jgi:two-component system response regulator DctR
MTAAASFSAPQRRWRVLIVEDNKSVADLHRRFVNGVPAFNTVHIAMNGEAAFAALPSARPDLAVLDLAMPGGGGLEFLRRVRTESIPLEVIVVTAHGDSTSVREAVHLGALDYLIKPFAPERLQEALVAFARRNRALRRSQLGQDDIDTVQATGGARIRRLPKGLKRTTLRAVVSTLDAAEAPLTADEVGSQIGVARVTARRYLEYLEVVGSAELLRERHGPGRPRNRYRRVRKAEGWQR